MSASAATRDREALPELLSHNDTRADLVRMARRRSRRVPHARDPGTHALSDSLDGLAADTQVATSIVQTLLLEVRRTRIR
jgi:hypothetical protein